mgnify:FL=1
MKRYARGLLSGGLMAMTLCTYADTPKVGSAWEDGIYLYREPIENYWNDWFGFQLMNQRTKQLGQATATIIGEGKTVEFIGNLSINCGNGKHYWQSANNNSEFMTNEEQFNEIVPQQVVKNAVKLFCKKP